MKPRSTPPRRIRRRQVADADRPPDEDDGLAEDQRQAEGEEQLVVVPGGVQPPDADVLDGQPQQRNAERRDEAAQARNCR